MAEPTFTPSPSNGQVVTIYSDLAGPVRIGHKVRVVVDGNARVARGGDAAAAAAKIERGAGAYLKDGWTRFRAPRIGEPVAIDEASDRVWISTCVEGEVDSNYANAEDLRGLIAVTTSLDTGFDDPADFPIDGDGGVYLTNLEQIDHTVVDRTGTYQAPAFSEQLSETLHDEAKVVGETLGTVGGAAGKAVGSTAGGLFAGLGWWMLVIVLALIALGVVLILTR